MGRLGSGLGMGGYVRVIFLVGELSPGQLSPGVYLGCNADSAEQTNMHTNTCQNILNHTTRHASQNHVETKKTHRKQSRPVVKLQQTQATENSSTNVY